MWKKISKIVISIILLFFIFLSLDFKDFTEKLAKISISGVLGALFFLIIQSLFVSLRWRTILSSYRNDISFLSVVKIHYLSLGMSLFLPNIVAEPSLKSLLLKKFKVPVKKSLLTVVLDKLFVIVGLFLMTLVAMPIIVAIYPASTQLAAFYFFVLTILIVTYFVYRFFGPAKTNFFLGKGVSKYPEIRKAFMRLIFDEGLILKCSVITLLSQVSSITALYILSIFMELDIEYYECLLLISPALLITTIPISFNGWGVREITIVYMLGLINVPSEVALALSVQFGFIGMLLWGLGLFSWVGYRK